ncbi:unnamed protein product, partial [marine sediment metagenome]
PLTGLEPSEALNSIAKLGQIEKIINYGNGCSWRKI